MDVCADPFVFYYSGYRYNQPNHILHVIMITNSFAYFIFDTIIETAYGSDDFLTNCHHVICNAVCYFCYVAPHSGFEFIRKRAFCN